VLFVCTGNICRSVIAATIFQSRADLEGWPVAATSAGLAGEGARPPRHTTAALRRRGIDVSEHRSRRLTGSMIDDSALVIGSSPEHAWAAATLRPDSSPRIFALKELVRAGRRQRTSVAAEGLRAWVARVDAARQEEPDTDDHDDVIDDPKGKSRHTYERVALEVERLVLQLIDLLSLSMQPVRHPAAAKRRTERRLPEARW
jgi:protein-tyrosine-phosphatase